MTFVNLCNFEPISFSNMLLAASNSLLNLGVRPRAVTTPLRIRSPSGTWGGGVSSTTSKDLRPNTPSRPAPTQTTHSAARKVHHFSTVHIPRLRERTAFDWKFHDEHRAQLTIFGPYLYAFAARRSNLAPAVTALSMPSEARSATQARRGAGAASESESEAPLQPLRAIQAQAQAQGQSLAAAASATVPSNSPGTKSQAVRGPDHQHMPLSATSVPNLLLLVPEVDHASLITEPPPLLCASASAGASAGAMPGAGASANSRAGASASANSRAGAGASASSRASATPSANIKLNSSATSQHVSVPAPARPESPLAHARRGARPNHVPPARIETVTSPSGTGYTLSIVLPRPGGALLASEMITVSARRGGRLAVVADAWHLEHDCV